VLETGIEMTSNKSFARLMMSTVSSPAARADRSELFTSNWLNAFEDHLHFNQSFPESE